MTKEEKLIETIKAVKVPESYDMRAWEAQVIHDAANLDTMRMITFAFEYGFLKGQRSAKAKLKKG